MKNYRYYCSKLPVIYFNGAYFLKLGSVRLRKLVSRGYLRGSTQSHLRLPSCMFVDWMFVVWLLCFNFLGLGQMKVEFSLFGWSEFKGVRCR